jgi:NDP-sugar pyrophosphorylase family protein
LLPRVDAPVLIVNADNLTAIDLVDVRRHHDDQQAAMTQAVHREPFHMPFGEIVVDGGGRISAYREKPVYEFLVSSAVTVVSPAAVGLVRRGENINLPVLANRVLEAALPLVAYVHCEPWVDVNDLETRRRAEQLLEDRASEFAARGIRPA